MKQRYEYDGLEATLYYKEPGNTATLVRTVRIKYDEIRNPNHLAGSLLLEAIKNQLNQKGVYFVAESVKVRKRRVYG